MFSKDKEMKKDKEVKKDLTVVEGKIMEDILGKEKKIFSKINCLKEVVNNIIGNVSDLNNKYDGYEERINQISGKQEIIDYKLTALQTQTDGMEMKFRTRISDIADSVEDRINNLNAKLSLLQTQSSKPKNKWISCEHCGKTFPAEDHYKNHILGKHTLMKNVKCYICFINIPDIRHLQGHLKRFHKTQVNDPTTKTTEIIVTSPKIVSVHSESRSSESSAIQSNTTTFIPPKPIIRIPQNFITTSNVVPSSSEVSMTSSSGLHSVTSTTISNKPIDRIPGDHVTSSDKTSDISDASSLCPSISHSLTTVNISKKPVVPMPSGYAPDFSEVPLSSSSNLHALTTTNTTRSSIENMPRNHVKGLNFDVPSSVPSNPDSICSSTSSQKPFVRMPGDNERSSNEDFSCCEFPSVIQSNVVLPSSEFLLAPATNLQAITTNKSTPKLCDRMPGDLLACPNVVSAHLECQTVPSSFNQSIVTPMRPENPLYERMSSSMLTSENKTKSL